MNSGYPEPIRPDRFRRFTEGVDCRVCMIEMDEDYFVSFFRVKGFMGLHAFDD